MVHLIFRFLNILKNMNSFLIDYLKILDEFFENMTLKIHIKVNSGMNRLGFDKNEILELVKIVKKYNLKKSLYCFLLLKISI